MQWLNIKNIPIIDKDYVIDEDNDEINNQIIEYLYNLTKLNEMNFINISTI